MKRIFSIIVGSLLFILPVMLRAANDDLNSEQIALRRSILNFIREEGFSPEIDTDGDIEFKYEGRYYYVRVYSADVNPMFVNLFSSYNYPVDYSQETVLLATKELNMYKGVKLLCFEDAYSINAQMYLRDAELFKSSFYKLLLQIKNVRDDVVSECEKVGGSGSSSISISEIPFIITKLEVANVENDGTIIQDYGSTIYDFKSKYLQPRITIRPFKSSGTYTVYVKLYKDNVLQRNTSSSPENYTYSTTVSINGSYSQTRILSGWGSKTAGTWAEGSYRFEVWFNDYCIGSKTFKVI